MNAAVIRTGELTPRVARSRPVRLRLWLPLTPLFWLLAPFALLFAPVVWLGIPGRAGNPYAWAIALGRLLLSTSGLAVDVQAPHARVFIRIF